MKHLPSAFYLSLLLLISSCKERHSHEKGFQIGPSAEASESEPTSGLSPDSLKLETRPGSVLLTAHPQVRLTTVFLVNTHPRDKSTYIGSTGYYSTYEDAEVKDGNNWNGNFMPGLEAAYGFNLVNVSLYDLAEDRRRSLFEKPVLIKTLYYPSYSHDTLNSLPVTRSHIMVSVYNEDTNKDGFINLKDLRRFYLFSMAGERIKALVPEDHSVFSSEYDSGNDLMYVFAQQDTNGNGSRDESEPIHIFWIDLKDPTRTGQLY